MPPRGAKRLDPYEGWLTFTTIRSGASAGQCAFTCRCGVSHWSATSGIAHELGTAHLAVHGVVIKVTYGPPDRNARTLPRDQVRTLRSLGLIR
jgi:hypothetical protein